MRTLTKHIDFATLKLELLRFSKYKISSVKKDKNSCSDAISNIESLQKKSENTQKYITVLIVSDNKLINHIRKKLDNFKLDFLKQYSSCDEESIEIYVYCFDVTKKSDKRGVLEIPCQSDKILSRTDNERRIRI